MKTGVNSTQVHVRNLMARIAAVRQKRRFVRTTTGSAFAIAMLVGVFVGETTLDSLVDLPWIARAFAFAGALGGAFFWLWRDAIQPLRKRMSDDAIASMIEHELPSFRTRYIASVQLARTSGDGASHLLVRALIEQTATMAAELDFRQVVKSVRLKRALRFATTVLAVAVGLAFFGGEATPLLISRALLFNTPLPHKTHILSVTGDRKIGIGEDVKIEVTARGVLPPGGRIIATGSTRASREFALERDPVHTEKYSALLSSPQESFTYYVKLNDATSETYRVQTLLRPAVVDVECEQTYPPYINLRPVTRPTGDLSLLVGSRLKVKVKANVNIGKASLHLEGLNKEVPLQIDPKDQTRLSAVIEIPPKDLTGFTVRMMNIEGVSSGESATYRIDLLPDREPSVKITYPTRREELATARASLRVAFEAKDDFGVVKAVLHYVIDQGEEKAVAFDLGGQKEVKNQLPPWKLSLVQPRVTMGNVIEFWVAVADGNNLTGPGVGTSEHYQTKIVSDEDKIFDMNRQREETISGVKEVTKTVDVLTKELGEVLNEGILQPANGNK